MEDKTTSSVTMESKVCPDAPFHPPSYGWRPSLLYNQHFGLPPFLEFRDLSWMESIFKKLWTSSWSGYARSSVFTLQPGLQLHRELGGGVSEVSTQQCRWKVSLDVNHFAPSEITVRTQDGFLEIGGKHDEREDEHGFVSRHFVRKYKLPAGIEAQNVRSFITGDGVLTVEVPLPEMTPPADVTVPVQVEIEVPKLADQTLDDGRLPKKMEVEEGDVVIPPSAGRPEYEPAEADERIGKPDDLSARGALDEAVTSLVDGKKREEEVKEEGAEERADSLGVPEAPEAPLTPDMVPPDEGAGIHELGEGTEILKPGVAGEPRLPEPADEVSVTQEEIPQVDIIEQQAKEQIKNIK